MEAADWFHQEKNQKFLEKLARVGVLIKSGEVLEEQKLKGKSFVVTGTLSGMSRDEAKEKIRRLGGKIQGSVSAKTDYLVCGENPGSKIKSAKKLGVPIVEESEFMKMIS